MRILVGKILAVLAVLSICLSSTLTVLANDVGAEIRRQQQEECKSKGGVYDYPSCHFDQAGVSSNSDDSSFGWVILPILGVGLCYASGICE